MAFAVVTGEIDWALVVMGVLVVASVATIFGLIGAEMAERRGREALAGALLGMLFWGWGLLVIRGVGRRRPRP